MHFYVHQYICIIMHLLSWSEETLPSAPLLLVALAGVSLWDLGHIWTGASCHSRAQLTENVHKNKSSNNHFLYVIQRMQCYYMLNQISNYIQKLLSTPRNFFSIFWASVNPLYMLYLHVYNVLSKSSRPFTIMYPLIGVTWTLVIFVNGKMDESFYWTFLF